MEFIGRLPGCLPGSCRDGQQTVRNVGLSQRQAGHSYMAGSTTGGGEGSVRIKYSLGPEGLGVFLAQPSLGEGP